MPADEDSTSGLIRTLQRAGVIRKPNGGVPWGKIGAGVGVATAVLGFVVAVKAQGWYPLLRVSFDRHVMEEFVPLNSDVICEKCKSECRTIMCPTCTELQCLERCRATGRCR